MSVFHNNALIGAGGGAAAAVAPGVRSLRFNSSDSAYLSRTPSSAGNRKTFTFSAWVKKTEIISSGDRQIFGSDSSGGAEFNGIAFVSTNALNFRFNDSGSLQIRSSAVHRDPSAWLHIVCVADTSQATASDRLKMYVNGAEVTDFSSSTYPSQNAESSINSTQVHEIGRRAEDGGQYFNGYLTDIYFVDGLALSPTSFGSYDSNGVWQRGTYSGTYGTNGFHILDFENEGTIGDDSSGNSNDFTANNLSDTAGVGNDVLLDFPVNGSESDTGAGGEVSGNYCCWNPLAKGSNMVLKNGNLDIDTTTGKSAVLGTIGMSSGKWYWETTINGSSDRTVVGIGKQGIDLSDAPGQGDALGYGYAADGGGKLNGGTSTSYGAGFSSGGDVIGCAFDADNGTLTFYKNGASQGTAFTGLTDGPYFPATGDASSVNNADSSVNFGQRVWAYSAPSNHKALCTTNLPTPTIADGRDYFDAKLWTGNSQDQRAITGYQFSPDWVWIKRRNASYAHPVMDTVRGLNSGHAGVLYTSATNSEDTGATSSIRSFNSDGFNLGTDGGVNFSGSTYIGWAWDAGSSTVSNTDGSVTSSVRANQSAGFSIVSYTGNGSSGTVGHGLNAAPEMIIAKDRDASTNWFVYHTSLGSNAMLLNSTAAAFSPAPAGINAASSSTFTLGGARGETNTNGNDYIAYCFAPVSGYQALGQFTGNADSGGDGPFVHTGFAPKWVLIKGYDASNDAWKIFDVTRSPFNVRDDFLSPNNANAEVTSNNNKVDLLSNGFKIRTTGGGDSNLSSKRYLYLAIAENPFQANGGLAR